MPIELSPSTAVAPLLGLGSGLLLFAFLAGVRERARARRLATLLGAPVPASPRPAPRRATRVYRLPGLTRLVMPSMRRAVLVIAITGCLVIGLLTGEPTAFAAAALMALLLLVLVSRTAAQAALERQTQGAVRLIASGLRAGLSTPQALALVAKECPEPTASEFTHAVHDVELGLSLDEALARLASRTTADYALVSTIVSVQHEVGGNLAQALEAVGETLRERSELRQHAAAVAAQQGFSSIILTALPIVVFLYTFVVNRSYLDPMFSSVPGRLLIVLACLLLVCGWRFMHLVGRVEE